MSSFNQLIFITLALPSAVQPLAPGLLRW